MVDVSSTDNVIDSRDVIARIEELEDERTALVEARDEAKETLVDAKDDTSALKDDEDVILGLESELETAEQSLSDWDSDNGDELKALKDLQDECNWGDWQYGATLISDDYFEEYAQDLAEDLGMDKNQSWPYSCIDWAKAAEELQQDYTCVSFDGNDYWIHS